MKLRNLFSAAMLFAAISFGFSSCGPKDADIKTSLEAKAKTSPELAGLNFEVKDGVATISGQVESEASKAAAEKTVADTKGVKSVVNNIIVVAPPPPTVTVPVETAEDTAIQTGLKDALKDFETVTGTVKDGIITLSGKVKKGAKKKLMQAVSTLKAKKIEVTGLTEE